MVITAVVNTIDSLGLLVTNERYCDYELRLKGHSKYSHEEQTDYANTVASLCKVHGVTKNVTNKITYHGSCSVYCRETYCRHLAVFQYSEQLRSKTKLVSHN